MASNQKGGIGSLGSVMASITARDAQDGSSAMVPPVVNDSLESDLVTESDPVTENNPIKKLNDPELNTKFLHCEPYLIVYDGD